MKACILTLFLQLCIFTGFSQHTGQPASMPEVLANKPPVEKEAKASFPGGDEHMMFYIHETVINKIYETSSTPRSSIPPATVVFSVNEQGIITDAKISASSKDPKIDQLFLEAIRRMPAWKPSENAEGMKVKQEFELSIPFQRSGC